MPTTNGHATSVLGSAQLLTPARSYFDLASRTEEQLAQVDLAETNLVCAMELPGAEKLDLSACFRRLNEWAEIVGNETTRLDVLFEQNSEAFQNSSAIFRMMVLVTVLQRDLGVYSHTKLNDSADFSDSRDLFIHGPLQGYPGTCSSLPVLYAAIGRRLGYPIKLACTAKHLFARWDDPKGERFNIECTVPGFDSPPDEHYLTWPVATAPETLQETYFLKSQTPREELAGFLIQRAYCLHCNSRHREAVECAASSHTLAPHHRLHMRSALSLMRSWDAKLRRKWPPNFPSLGITFPPRRLPALPLELEQETIHLEVMESLLEDPIQDHEWWEPLRRSPWQRPAFVPSHIEVTVHR